MLGDWRNTGPDGHLDVSAGMQLWLVFCDLTTASFLSDAMCSQFGQETCPAVLQGR